MILAFTAFVLPIRMFAVLNRSIWKNNVCRNIELLSNFHLCKLENALYVQPGSLEAWPLESVRLTNIRQVSKVFCRQ